MIKNTYTPLLTDLYQLTMAYGYWRLGMHEQEAVFNLIYRNNPFKGNYALACGIGSIVDYLCNWRFQPDDLAYLASLKNVRGGVLFPQEFLDYLSDLHFSCDIDAAPEGSVVFPHIPLVRVQGPLLQCQLIETPLLNMINFQTLIATKASRVVRAAAGDTVIEFGLRRAQGPDGGLSASRAAYIGGCHATSNTLAGKLYDIPVRGTHAHSWVTAFPSEQLAFEAYVDVMPDNCVLLVDTYNTLAGVKHAISVGKKLRAQGSELLAVRLDSGDMADLSIKARALLDKAGFQNTHILASNSLDEHSIEKIKAKGGQVSAWGVGTNLVTAYDQPALDGVYKLSALRDKSGEWQYKLKLSETPIKISNPGIHQVRRFFAKDQYMMDVLYDTQLGIDEVPQSMLLDKRMPKIDLNNYDAYVELLKPIMRKGDAINLPQSIHSVRHQSQTELYYFLQTHANVAYPVGLEKKLYSLKQKLIGKHRPNIRAVK